jgi:hypothetical protein
MVDAGEYFTINRPRQYGKTTTLNCLSRVLKDQYSIIDTSFEGSDDEIFSSTQSFCRRIFKKFARDTKFSDKNLSAELLKLQQEIVDFDTLSDAISSLATNMGKAVVLLIDEVDKNSSSKVFLQFLGLLRNKYLSRAAGKDIAFQSVVLAGIHDVKNLKLAIRNEDDTRFNSPWNIAVKFNIDMSFSGLDIEGMLAEYKVDKALDFGARKIADEIHKLTNGYPYLVSDLCQIIDEELHCDWTLVGVAAAAKIILKEKSTLFDDVIKNIENNKEIKDTVIAMLFEGKNIEYNPDTYEQGILYGIFIEKNGKLTIHNQLFEDRLYAYLIGQRNVKQLANPLLSIEQGQFIETGRLDMEKTLRKFREFMKQEYRHKDDKFYETNGRLLCLAYLRPIINGNGFAFVEPETRENKRMDIVVTYGSERFIIELKLWHGPGYEQKGLEQLAAYLDIQNAKNGWLVVFGLGKMADTKPEWIEINEKNIFKVIV